MIPVYAGVDLGGTTVKIGLVDKQGNILVENKVPSKSHEGAEQILKNIVHVIQELLKQNSDYILEGVGAGMPGQIDVQKGIILEGVNLFAWRNIPAVAILSHLLNVPVKLDNDANVAALAEYAFGAGQGKDFMLMVTLGTGVGSGFILDGKLYHGSTDIAGEFGHMKIFIDGEPCTCGDYGCLEAYIGTKGLQKQVQKKIKEGCQTSLSQISPNQLMPKDISIAAEAGDEIAKEILQKTGEYLGFALANVNIVLNLSRVVVGGGVANAGECILKPARETLRRRSLSASAETIDVVPASLGEKAGLIGAASLVILKEN